jgi:transposase
MEATDMRKLSRDARHERRVQVLRLRKASQTCDEIAAQTGLSRTGVFDICRRHEAAGAKGLHDAPSGRKAGDGRLLDAAQEAMVRSLITDKTPDQLKMRHALWTRAAVAQLIKQRFGIRLPGRTMGLYLARWGFTPQKPMKKAYELWPAPGRSTRTRRNRFPVWVANQRHDAMEPPSSCSNARGASGHSPTGQSEGLAQRHLSLLRGMAPGEPTHTPLRLHCVQTEWPVRLQTKFRSHCGMTKPGGIANASLPRLDYSSPVNSNVPSQIKQLKFPSSQLRTATAPMTHR